MGEDREGSIPSWHGENDFLDGLGQRPVTHHPFYPDPEVNAKRQAETRTLIMLSLPHFLIADHNEKCIPRKMQTPGISQDLVSQNELTSPTDEAATHTPQSGRNLLMLIPDKLLCQPALDLFGNTQSRRSHF